MGSILVGAHKVFVDMAEREKFSKFENYFGGSQTYIQGDRMVVLGFNLVKKCRMAKVR
jgi:hypothetical protein